MPEITLRDIYSSQQEMRVDQQAMQQSLQGTQKVQQEMLGSFKEMRADQQEMRKSIQELSEVQQETLAALHAFATHVDHRFSQVDARFTQIEATMVTKDYLDNKLADLRGDLVLLARKGNTKLSTLIERLVEEKRLDPKVAHQILIMEPFPQA